MANVFNMMKQAASMQKQMKKMQKELAKKKVTFETGGGKVTVVAKGDMSIDSVTIRDDAMAGGDAAALGKMVTQAVNGALSSAKKEAGAEMAKMTGGLGGLSDLLGGC